MAINLTIRLLNRPGTLAEAADALGRAGANIEGATGYVCGTGEGIFHVLVTDAEQARRALIDAGFEIQHERPVALATVANRPGEGAKMLRQIAHAGLNLDLLYMTADGRIVLCGEDASAIEAAIR